MSFKKFKILQISTLDKLVKKTILLIQKCLPIVDFVSNSSLSYLRRSSLLNELSFLKDEL